MRPLLSGSNPRSRTLTVRQLADKRGFSPVKVSLQGNQKGFSVIEILVLATALFATMGALIGFASFSLGSVMIYKQTAQAASLAQEAMEAARSFRDAVPWNNDDINNEYDGLGVMAVGSPYHPRKSLDAQPTWQFAQGQETQGIFTRSVTFENSQRDAQQNLVESGGAPDPETRTIVVRVSWSERSRSHSVSLTSYLTNWK